jgi:hypothetical protein
VLFLSLLRRSPEIIISLFFRKVFPEGLIWREGYGNALKLVFKDIPEVF